MPTDLSELRMLRPHTQPRRVLSQAIGVWLLFFASLTTLAQNSPPLRLEVAGFSPAGFGLIIYGPDGNAVTLEASDNFVDWEAIESFEIADSPLRITDNASLLELIRQRFYRLTQASQSNQSDLDDEPPYLAGAMNVLAGDTIALRVVGNGVEETDWAWELVANDGGGSEIGLIRTIEGNLTAAFYTPPTNTANRCVTIRAYDPIDPTRELVTEVKIHGLEASLSVQPPSQCSAWEDAKPFGPESPFRRLGSSH